MKNLVKKIKEKKGYVSVEMIILAGLLIALAVAVISGLQKKSNSLAQNGANNINRATTSYTSYVETPIS